MRVSSYIPPLCSFSSAPLWNQISVSSVWRAVIFCTCFWNIKYTCWNDSALVLQLRKSTDDIKISEKKKSQCRLTLTYAQMMVLRLSLARQQNKDELQHPENTTDFSYKILQHLSVRMSAFLNEIFLIYIFKSSGVSSCSFIVSFFP